MRKKRNIINTIGAGFKAWGNNFIIVLLFIFCILASLVVALILFSSIGAIFMKAFPIGLLTELKGLAENDANEISSELMAQFSSLMGIQIFYLIIAVIISLLIIELVRAYFFSGAIGMAVEISKNKKTSLSSMIKNGNKFFWRYWLAKLVIVIGILIWFAVFSLPSLLSGNIKLIYIPFVSIIPLIFILMLFALVEFCLVLGNLSVFGAIKKSISVVKSNYWEMFGLVALFYLMMGIISFIPWIGSLAGLLVFIPVQIIAFTIFAIERIKK